MKLHFRVALGLVAGLSLAAAGVSLLWSQEHRLSLRRELTSQLSSAALWAHLETAFRESTASPLWPNELETLRSEGLAAGAQVTATYATPFGTSTHTYTISEYSPGRGFTYATGPEHPLRGGGRVLLQPGPDGTTLIWSVDYSYRGLSPSALFTRLYFVPRFFSRLEANLRMLQ